MLGGRRRDPWTLRKTEFALVLLLTLPTEIVSMVTDIHEWRPRDFGSAPLTIGESLPSHALGLRKDSSWETGTNQEVV